MKNKLFITTCCLFAVITTARAQHELSINGFGGFQPVNFSLTEGTNSGNFGGGAGIGYNYNFNKTWSIGTGVDFSFYGAAMKFDRFASSHTDFDVIENTAFEFTADATNLNETVSAMLLEIPLTARYTLPINEKNSLRFIGGFKFGLPLSAKYTVSAGNLETRGRYETEDQEYHDVPEVFMSGKMAEHSGSWDAKMSVQLTLEAAYRFAIGEQYGLSLGVYFNYGLNDMQGISDKNPIAFAVNENNPYVVNSFLDSKYASAIRPMAIGLKVRFDLGL